MKWCLEFQHLFKANYSWRWAVSLRVSPCAPVAFGVGPLVLHVRHTRAIMCSCGGLHQRIYEKSILQTSCTYRWSSFSRHVSDASGKTKEHIKQLLNK